MKFPVCRLSEIINPGAYMVVTCDKEHVSEVKRLEERMTVEMSNAETCKYQITPKMIVAVVKLKKNLLRGVIEEQIDENHYEVMLMDYGQVVRVNKSAIRVITNESFIEVEPLSFIVKLYGLVPVKLVHGDGSLELRACEKWGLKCKKFVADCFKEKQKILVQSIVIQQRTVYGDLFIKNHSNSKFISLRKLLCKNKFCAYSERDFLAKEGLKKPSENLEWETKLELVKKWRNENFEEFKNNIYKLPSSKFSSVTSTSDFAHLKTSECAPSASHLDAKTSQEVCESENISSISAGERRGIGVGRSKLLSLLAKIQNKKSESAAESGGSNAIQSDSNDALEKMPRLPEKFSESQSEAFHSGGPTTESENSRKELLDAGSEKTCSFPKATSGCSQEFSELGSQGNTLRKEDSTLPPPVRNILTDENFKNAQVEAERSSLEREEKEICVELKRSEDKKEKEETDKKQEGEVKREEEEMEDVERSELGEHETWIVETNQPEWEGPSKLIKSSSCWAPFVLFDDSVVQCINSFTDLPIQPRIIKQLEGMGNFSSPSSVQRWAIPAIRKQHNTVIIGSAKTGKTLSYLIPLVDFVHDEVYFEELPAGNGPSVVILASSSNVCESIHLKCRALLGERRNAEYGLSKVRLLMVYGGAWEKEMWVQLTNGCDILISTPPCLVRLLKYPVITNLERLMCLVLDEVDVMSENPFRKDVRMILEKAELSTKGRHYQRILCGEQWTGKVESIAKTYVRSYTVVIGSYLEAVVYERLTPSIFLVEKKHKAEVVLKEVKERLNSRIVIFCEGRAEVVHLSEFLSQGGIKTLVAHEKVLAEGLKETERVWKNSSQSVLVMSDGVLNEVDVREAQVLVHFDIPFKSKTNFFLRYITVLQFYQKQRTVEKTQSQGRTARVLILIDDENHYQLPHIVDFVRRLGGKLPEKIVERCDEIRRAVEVSKCSSPICDSLLAFGRCRNWKQCRQRHALVKSLDTAEQLPRSGWVNFEVVKSLNVSLMAVRLLEHVDIDGKVRRLEDRRREVKERVKECFREEGRRRPVGVVGVGSVCGVSLVKDEKGKEENVEVFYRGEVIEVVNVDKYAMPLVVSVKLLDEGSVWIRKVGELYELEEELAKEPPTVVDVRMVGVQAIDYGLSWSKAANMFARELMTQRLKESQYWSGKVVLSLRNTLFLEELKRKQFLPNLNVHVFDMMVQEELLNNKIAVLNPEHLPSLYKLSKDADIDIPKNEEIKKEDTAKVEPQWAFFDAVVVKVKFLAAEKTSTIFVQIKKFVKLLEALEEDCQLEGAAMAERMKAEQGKKSVARVGVGKYCLARFEDGKWNRGRVESETESQFCVFFVDHGDFLFVPKEDVVPISLTLLLRLPCQAIECRLVGIEEMEECPKELLEEIYEFSEDGAQDLYARVTSKELKAEVTHGRKYNVILMNKKRVSLNKMLVEEQMVRLNENERCYLEEDDTEENWETEEGEEEGEDEDEEEVVEGEREQQQLEEEQHLSEKKEKDELTPSELKSLNSYFDSLSDDVFKDENSVEFLKEFASKLFPKFNDLVEMNAEEETPPKTEAAKKSCPKPLDVQKESSSHKKDLELKSRENVLTPQVLWCQNKGEIRLRILLANVSDYSVECTHRNFSFRCLLDEKFYAVDMRLFGVVNPQMTTVTAKAFDVTAVMVKLASPPWPRLLADEGKHRWISLDVEGLKDKEYDFEDRISEAKRELESGQLKQGFRAEKIEPYSDSEDSNGRNISSESEDSDDCV